MCYVIQQMMTVEYLILVTNEVTQESQKLNWSLKQLIHFYNPIMTNADQGNFE